ncbi:hypothetical protein CQW23_28920 [Capsicum baccatum]|uniref:Uncharacterized protein n=1 Tax=Capsicum baccatum TaxID=33114 RepID=A0A2G2VHZ4_CAPBA|nr:hypothetical protein CQW23_28920 [Capsicum baccatum]
MFIFQRQNPSYSFDSTNSDEIVRDKIMLNTYQLIIATNVQRKAADPKMRQRKISLCFLIVILAKCFDDYWWVISTRRSQLLEESIEFIGDMDPTLLRGDLFMGLRNEEATELGLLKE